MSELNHIAFIPDGNRRWAKNQGLPTLEGHRRGYGLVKELADWCLKRDIREMTFWGFSTENWKRSKKEVAYLMDLFLHLLKKDVKEFSERGVRLKVIGRQSDLPDKVVEAIKRAEDETKDHQNGQFNLCFNYGGRSEMLDGVRQCLRDGLDPDALTEEQFQERLWTSKMTSDIDLIIRTSGEQRLSGFQPWRGAYSELYFTQAHWPDFSEEELDNAISWYTERERRFGGDSSK